MKNRLLTTILLLFVFFACSSPGKEKTPENAVPPQTTSAPQAAAPIESGKMVNPVLCASDAEISYAAYLPTNYDAQKKYPLIIAFDAHAGGRIPIEAYHELCEKYGYVMVASNNSKNGMDPNTLNSIVTVFISDVKSRISFDPKRVYLLGFSGGARVAAGIALQGGYAGLASCSAGFQSEGAVPFNFIGFAGTEDFNSNEMIELNKKLSQTNQQHQLILYDGKHEWPSAEVFENAFVWFELNAMKDKLIAQDAAFVNKIKQAEDSKIKSFQAKGKNYEALVETEKSINFLNGISDCSELKTLKNKLENSTVVKNTLTEKEQISKQEAAVQNYYRQAIQEKDLTWWNTEVDKLIAQSKSSKNSHEAILFYKRTLSFLSLLSYMASNSMLNQNQFAPAAQYLQLYEKVDPSNSEVYYLQAVLAAKQQNLQAVLPLLQKAVNKGFIESDRIEKEVLFDPVRQSPDYASLITKINSNK